MLAFYNADLQLDWESGEFEIMIGTNSEKVQKETINWQKQCGKLDFYIIPSTFFMKVDGIKKLKERKYFSFISFPF